MLLIPAKVASCTEVGPAGIISTPLMNYTFLSVLFTVIGCLGLLASIFPARYICKVDTKNCLSWKILGTLILFFIIGYFVFVFFILRDGASLLEFEVSLILCGGGVFVPLVFKMSTSAMDRIMRISQREQFRACHDQLTNLPNRIKVRECIDEAIANARKSNTPVSLLLLDIDRLKEINNALGFQYGDFVLQATANRLNTIIRPADTASRLGGDEFAVVLPNVDLEQAIVVAEKINREMEKPFAIDTYNLNIELSLGIALFPDHGDDCDSLLKRADVAMYTAKHHERKYAIYEAAQDKYTTSRLKLTEELRQAIKDDQLILHYQPKISTLDGRLCGVEALVRWQKSSQELLPPDLFIGLAEQTGLIRSLTHCVLNKAFEQKIRWQQSGLDIPVSVNISIKNLQDLDFPFHVRDLLKKWNVNAAGIIFEITESSMMLDPDRTYEVISNLYSLGINISIDDFGTGYSSLAFLKQLPAAEIKIDKSFVMDMVSDENDAVIVKSTIELAHNMGLRVVAEGVENKTILERLNHLGCRIMQGHHISPPLPADELFMMAQATFPQSAAVH